MQTISPFQKSSHILYTFRGLIFGQQIWFFLKFLYYDILKQEKCSPEYKNAPKSQEGQIQDGRHYPMAKMKIFTFKF